MNLEYCGVSLSSQCIQADDTIPNEQFMELTLGDQCAMHVCDTMSVSALTY